MARKKIGDVLVEMGIIDAHQLQSALAHQRQWGGKIGKIIVEKRFASEKAIVDALAQQLQTKVVPLRTLPKDERALKLIPLELARKHNLFPFQFQPSKPVDQVMVAMSDPTDLAAIDEVSFRSGKKVVPALASDSDIEWAIKKHYLGEENPVVGVEAESHPLPPPQEVPFGGRELAEEEMEMGEEGPVLQGQAEPTSSFSPRPAAVPATVADPLAALFDDMPPAEPDPLDDLWEGPRAAEVAPADAPAEELPADAYLESAQAERQPEEAVAQEGYAVEPVGVVEELSAAEESVEVAEERPQAAEESIELAEDVPPAEEVPAVYEEPPPEVDAVAAHYGDDAPPPEGQVVDAPAADAEAWQEGWALAPSAPVSQEGYAEEAVSLAEESVAAPDEGEDAAAGPAEGAYAAVEGISRDGDVPGAVEAAFAPQGFAEGESAGEPAYAEGEPPPADAGYAEAVPVEGGTAAEGLYAETLADGAYAEAPADGGYAEAAADGVYAEPPADGAYAEAAADGAYAEAAADGAYAEPPADSAYAEAPADGVYAEAPPVEEGAGAEGAPPAEHGEPSPEVGMYAEALPADGGHPEQSFAPEPVPAAPAEELAIENAEVPRVPMDIAGALAAGQVPEGTDSRWLVALLFRALVAKGLLTEAEIRDLAGSG